jgi:hypothetical protein
MKMRLKMIPALLGLATVGLLNAGAADAATKINGDIQTFSKQTPEHTLTARPDSFYNLTMGYQGWTHHSAWGNVKLKKGNLYTITAEMTNPNVDLGFHPAIAVWYRPQGAGLVPNIYANDHFYNQWDNIIAYNVTNEADGAKLGTLKQYFVVNGVDRDGWEATDPDVFDQGNIIRILDGNGRKGVAETGPAGRVQVQFVAKDSGWYQFVIGGINPNPPLNDNSAGRPGTIKYAIKVTVQGL